MTTEPEQVEPPRGLDRLLELQGLDLSIDRLESRRAHLEAAEDLAEARQRVARVEAWVGEVRLSLDTVGREQRRLESDIVSMEQKIAAERARLYDGSVANAKELQSIEAEIKSLEGRKSRKEDDLLEQMERTEELEGHLKPAEAEAEEARQRLAEVDQGSARELVEVEHSLASLRSERTTLLPAFDEDLLELYEDLRRQKRGVGAATLTDGVCQGCHQKLSPVYLDRLKRVRGVWRCEYCRRILVSA